MLCTPKEICAALKCEAVIAPKSRDEDYSFNVLLKSIFFLTIKNNLDGLK